MIWCWIARYHIVNFSCDSVDLQHLEDCLNNHPRRATTASLFQSKGYSTRFKCKDQDLKGSIDYVTQTVKSAKLESQLPDGITTYEQRQILKWVLKVYFITFGSLLGVDSVVGLTLTFNIFINQLEVVLTKDSMVSLVPTLATWVALEKKG